MTTYRGSGLAGAGAVTTTNAADVTNTPSGSVAATDVQSAINELDTEKLAIASNLSDVANASIARTNLGVEIGSDVQAYDSTYLVDADIGVNVQAYDADLTVFGANPLTAAELGELQNIGTSTVSATQWGYLGGTDQALATTDDVEFGIVTADNISFPATQVPSADANTLDDYEEGLWTPALQVETTAVYTSSGVYTKTGDTVFCEFTMSVTTLGDTSQDYAIYGLPFTSSANGIRGGGALGEWTGLVRNVYSVNMTIPQNDDRLVMYTQIAFDNSNNITTLLTDGSVISGSFTYKV